MTRILSRSCLNLQHLGFYIRQRGICASSLLYSNVFTFKESRYKVDILNLKRSLLKDAVWSRCYANKPGSKKNYYNVLGVSPKASQSKIKDAYYKLSMKHHPDRHQGSDKKHEVFQEIAEAYSVLGNLESRKQYDRGLIVEGSLAPEHARAAHGPPRRTGSIYDFDEWTKQHYYEALKRRQRDKKERRDEKFEQETHKVQEGSLRLVVLLVFLLIVVIYTSTERQIHKQSMATSYKEIK